jgi:glycosyltransferase involved in cell wall biosynthesis
VYGAYFTNRLDELDVEIIVIVVDTDDETAKIVNNYSQKYPFIKHIETDYNSGKGGAVALGFNKADGDFIGFVDADGAVPATEVYKLYEFLEETPWLDGVIGVRTKETTQISLKRRILKKIYNLYVKLLFKLPYQDTQCGAKFFRKKAAKAIARKLSHTGWTFDVNVLLVAKYLSFRIMEHPVSWSEKRGSKFSVYEALINVPRELLELRCLEVSYNVKKAVSKLLKFVSPLVSKDECKSILIFAWRDLKHPGWGGSEVYIHEVAKRLARKHRVTVFTSKPGNLNHIDAIDNVRIVRRGNFVTVYPWAVYYYLKYFRKDTDFIVDVENGIPFFTPLFAARKPKVLLIHHIHKAQWFSQFNLTLAAIGYMLETYLMPHLYRKVPVVTVSPSSLEEIKEIGLNEKKIYLGYNSIPKRVGKSCKRSERPLMVYVGRIKAYKQLDLVIKKMPLLIKEFPHLKFTIAGTGDYLDELKVLAKRVGVTNNVDFLGFVSEEKKWELLQRAWVFVMPSMKEGWGITIMEAASCGTPSVGFNVGGVRDSIRDNYTGLLAEDEEQYYQKIRFLLRNSEVRDQLEESCKAWVGRFSWESTVDVFESLVETYCEGKDFLTDRAHPWELDVRTGAVTTLSNIK